MYGHINTDGLPVKDFTAMMPPVKKLVNISDFNK
jgi:hypothetical protein